MERDLAPLPAPMASIIGRSSEIEVARRLIEQDEVRLLSLTGPAGVGKTRLALEVAAVCAPRFAGNVSFIPLATLSDSRLLLGEIASALGVPDSVDPIAGVRQLVRSSRRLLVLDNLEQLPDAGLELARLLPVVGGLTILVTSRSPLLMYGEYTLPVDPLPVPAREAEEDQLAASPAIQLLVDSARSVHAARAIPPSEYPLLAEIARRVDGLPLALELAGAYIPLLGAQGVLDALADSLSVLGGGPRDLPERLQTMRNAIGWSYDLLTLEEQALFRRLSVFTGGFTFEMAEAMTRGWQPEDGYPYLFGLPLPLAWMTVGKEGPEVDRSDWTPATLPALPLQPLAGVDSLVRQNLIRPVQSDGGIDRFELLETIREFGLEQLERHGETEAARHAHATLLMSTAEFCGVAMWGPDWRPAVAWVEAELPNIRSALAWLATQPPDANQLRLRLIEGLWPFWQSRGYASEGCAHLEAALASPGGTPGGRTAALNLLGALSWIRNDLDRAASALDEALPILQELGLDAGLGRNFLFRALVAWTRRDFDRVEKMALIARKHFVSAHDMIGGPMSSLIQGVVARARQDRSRAAAHFEDALRGFEQHADGGFIWGLGISHYYLGVIAGEEGDRVTSVSSLRLALELLVDIGDPWTVGGCVGTLATYRIRDGELEEGARLLGAAQKLESSHGVFLPPTELEIQEVAMAELRQRIGPDAFAALVAEGERLSMQEAASRAMGVTMESLADRARRTAGRPPHPLRANLTTPQLRTLQMLNDGMSIKQIALADGRKPNSVYERVDRIREAFGLPQSTSLLELLRFVDREEIL